MIELKVYVRKNKTKDGKEFNSYSAKTKNGEWVDIVFAKDVSQKPDVSSIVKVLNGNIFKSNKANDKRDTYVIMEVEESTPITRELIEDDFFN